MKKGKPASNPYSWQQSLSNKADRITILYKEIFYTVNKQRYGKHYMSLCYKWHTLNATIFKLFLNVTSFVVLLIPYMERAIHAKRINQQHRPTTPNRVNSEADRINSPPRSRKTHRIKSFKNLRPDENRQVSKARTARRYVRGMVRNRDTRMDCRSYS